MNPRISGRLTLGVALCALAASCGALTAATTTDNAVHVASIDGSDNVFDIVVTGAMGLDAAQWQPGPEEWRQGRPDAVNLNVGDQPQLISPGDVVTGAIAVRNASPRIGGQLRLVITDPVPRGQQTDPETGRFVELFDKLLITVVDETGTVLYDRVPAPNLPRHTWEATFAPDDRHVLDVAIELPAEVDNRWQEASTDILFSFEAVSK